MRANQSTLTRNSDALEPTETSALNENASLEDHDGADTVADTEGNAPTRTRGDGVHLKELLYYIAEEQSRLNGYVHRGVLCNGCYMKPIRGIRWRCVNCADYDLCSECESMSMHPKTHIFYKVKIPAPFLGNPRQAQPVVYPGIPNAMRRDLPVATWKKLAEATNFDKEEIDALYDQFTCLANARWTKDPHDIGYAINRVAFDTAFIPLLSHDAPQPNLLYDRIFSFYDSNGDGLIGFEELLTGLSYVQRKSRDEKARTRIVFNGFDIDGDGYISRRDVLRLFRAYYNVQKDIIHDLIAVQEEEFDIKQVDSFINSTQPLSAIFTEPAPAPSAQTSFSVEEKPSNTHGDRREGDNALFESSNDHASRQQIIGELANQRPRALDDEPYMSDSSSASAKSSHDSDSLISSQDKATAKISDRLKRRQFYTDEEEGWQPPNEDIMKGGKAEYSISQRTPLGLLRSAPIWNVSNGSSKDMIETPAMCTGQPLAQVMAHKGYEVPIPDTGVGKEILYQVIQEGLNEILDPLFKAKEDVAIEVEATAQERIKWEALIKEVTAISPNLRTAEDHHVQRSEENGSPENNSVFVAPETMALPSQTSSGDDVDDRKTTKGSTLSKPCNDVIPDTESQPGTKTPKDPTMPQFRPNSDVELAAQHSHHNVGSSHMNGSVNNKDKSESMQAKHPSLLTSFPPSRSQLEKYAALNVIEQEIMVAGGPGRLSFEEFEELMRGEKGRKLAFVESWFELGSF
jgi:Ca2+-binding EF-hand superfamily protein